MTVLIVDDDPDIRTIGTLSLTEVAHWRVIEAASGDEAVELAAREQPDVILLDVTMPRCDGPETLARLRADAATATIPVIYLTARTVVADLAARTAGEISKPFDPMTLAAQILRILQRK